MAAIYSVGLHDMSRHMQPFMSLYPQARVLLECLHPHKVVEAVLEDEADLGILSYPAADRALEVLPLREEPMVLVCHPEPSAGPPPLWSSPADLTGREVRGLRPRPGRSARPSTARSRQHNVKVES